MAQIKRFVLTLLILVWVLAGLHCLKVIQRANKDSKSPSLNLIVQLDDKPGRRDDGDSLLTKMLLRTKREPIHGSGDMKDVTVPGMEVMDNKTGVRTIRTILNLDEDELMDDNSSEVDVERDSFVVTDFDKADTIEVMEDYQNFLDESTYILTTEKSLIIHVVKEKPIPLMVPTGKSILCRTIEEETLFIQVQSTFVSDCGWPLRLFLFVAFLLICITLFVWLQKSVYMYIETIMFSTVQKFDTLSHNA